LGYLLNYGKMNIRKKKKKKKRGFLIWFILR
jgi:hypothetical protein